MLAIEGLSKHFGGVQAVQRVDLNVRQNEILGLIGPNGSGKSTIVNLVTGVFPPTEGRVRLRDRDITGWQTLWVAQNVHSEGGRGVLRRWLAVDRASMKKIEATLEFCRLRDKKDELARNLGFGEQRRRGLAPGPGAGARL